MYADSPKQFGQGFSLLVLLMVLVIIGLLASYVGLRYFSQLGKSETKVARVQIDAGEGQGVGQNRSPPSWPSPASEGRNLK